MLFRSFVIVKKSNEKTEKSNLFVHHSILSDQQFLLKRYFLTTGFKYICFLKRLISQQLYIFLCVSSRNYSVCFWTTEEDEVCFGLLIGFVDTQENKYLLLCIL